MDDIRHQSIDVIARAALAVAEKATPAPWLIMHRLLENGSIKSSVVAGTRDALVAECFERDSLSHLANRTKAEIEANASLVIMARTGLPVLARAALAHVKERDTLRAALGEACRLIDGMIRELAAQNDSIDQQLDAHRARLAELERLVP